LRESVLCLLAATFVTVVAAGAADEVLRSAQASFAISAAWGNLLGATAGETAILAECQDLYLWRDDSGEVLSSEAQDQVVDRRQAADGLVLTCRNDTLDETITKHYALAADGWALAKTVSVGPLRRRGELRVRSLVALAPAYRQGALNYSARQSWGAPADRDLSGIRAAAGITSDVVSGAGWDNRLVAAFREGAPALGHYRWAVRGQHVMPSAVVGAWGAQSAQALTYTPAGWHFQLLHTLDGEKAPVEATAHYLVCPGDWLDVWRRYRALPEHRVWDERPVPEWVSRCKAGGFWQVTPADDKPQIEGAHATARRLGGGYLPLGVFAWSLDGDYETERPFLNEPGSLILTPEYLQTRVAAFQADPQVQLGLYFQGCLIDSLSAAFRNHPEWALQTADGKPFFSGFRDNPAGEMHFFNPLDEAWCEHYRQRLVAVCKAYQPGWIYCDGGVALETSDYRLRRPVLPDTWNDFFRQQQETVHNTAPGRAVLLNSQGWPYGDLYWLECSFFGATAPWRQAVEFCFDTKVLHTPQRAMLPLYWSDETRYLALCVAFGFTPCTSGTVGAWDERVWRAIDWAYAMRRAELVLSSRAVSPVWWQEAAAGRPGDVVCFAERVGKAVVIPVLNFGPTPDVRITVDGAEAGVPDGAQGWLVHPFENGADESLGPRVPADGRLDFTFSVPPGFAGLRLLVLGREPLL